MSKALSLIEIGSTVSVDVNRVTDRIPTELIQLLSDDPVGTVIDYKMTDGMGIGLVLEFNDGTTSWFFDDEIGRT